MFKNFLKSTIRNLLRNKGYSFLNIFGLAIGIACAGFIFLWVEDEINFDSNNINKDRIYLVKTNATVDDGVFTHSSTAGPMAPAMQSTIPGIENTCRTTESSTSFLFTIGNKSVNAQGKYVEPSFFNMFTLPFVEGSAVNAFNQLHSIVLTQKTAIKFFGKENSDSYGDVIGKTVHMDNKQDYVVSGVLKDLPENSTFQFEWLAPFKVYLDANPRVATWFNFGINTYVELQPGIDANAINKKLLNPSYDFTTQKIEKEKSSVHVFLFGMNNWHLRDDFDNGKMTGSGRTLYVNLFSIIAWIILFIACINFMNLATAGSEKRSKEIGVRKVLGSGKKRLIVQFVGEAIFMSLLAAVVAVMLMLLLLPAFNSLVQKNLSLSLANPYHLTALLLLTLICGLVAGSYPSLYLSSFNPVFVLKGIKIKTGSASLIRKGLVVTQFAVSIVLIISTIIIYQQIQHIKSRDLGYNKDNLVQVDAQGDIVKDFPAIRQDLMNTGFVKDVALADHTTLDGGNNTTSINWQGKDPNSNIVISQRLVSREFMSTTGMHIIEGRDFQPTDEVQFNDDHTPKDSIHPMNVIVTESMTKLLGKGSAIGKIIDRQTDRSSYHLQVAGVIKDYVYGDMYGKSAPVIFYNIPQAASLLYVKTTSTANIERAIAGIAAVMKKDNPAYPFEYKFVDDQFNQIFLSEMLISKLSRVFAALAIVISCLGLFGLAAYTAERRKKEIGVRKVLGASVAGITTLLSKDFLKLIGIACLVAFPVAWWIMNNWLQTYQYRITISWWIFIAAGIISILIALITISFQSIKAAVANPVKSLRTE
ncbi:MAG: ABC transporter permease [Bacteroidota bacterium]|nr:ABC transporter permease [Bacteroidota bacterium]